jgi:hypothetical protein
MWAPSPTSAVSRESGYPLPVSPNFTARARLFRASIACALIAHISDQPEELALPATTQPLSVPLPQLPICARWSRRTPAACMAQAASHLIPECCQSPSAAKLRVWAVYTGCIIRIRERELRTDMGCIVYHILQFPTCFWNIDIHLGRFLIFDSTDSLKANI